MKLYYLASPYSKGDMNKNYRECKERDNILRDLGYDILNPITHSRDLHADKERPYSYWIRLALELVDRCDGIILSPGWQDSDGCIAEFLRASNLGKEILYYDDIINGKEKEEATQTLG